MKLTYRGIAYDYNPPMLEVTKRDLGCKYRGQDALYTAVHHVPIPQPAERLTYRGVAYQTTRQGTLQQLTPHAARQTTQQPAHRSGNVLAGLSNRLSGNSSASRARRQLLQESSRQHNDSIARSLHHRMDVARAEGNATLLQQLESEMRQSEMGQSV